MADEDDEQVLILSCSCVILSSVLLSYAVQKRKKASFRLGAWLFKERNRYGAYRPITA